LYDISESDFERIQCVNSTGAGINAQMTISSRLLRCITYGNAGVGILVDAGLKNSTEFNSNAVVVDGCVSYSNLHGVQVRRSKVCNILNGDYSANTQLGLLLDGADRCLVQGIWCESNSTGGLTIQNNVGSPTYNGDHNLVHASMVAASTGVGTVSVLNGSGNALTSNYLGNAVTVGANATSTYVGVQKFIGGSFTDSGAATIYEHNPTDRYIRASTAKRYSMSVGSTVDFTSDIQAFRWAQLRGLSTTSTFANNLFGFVDIVDAATSANVTFGTAETDAAYGVVFGVWHVAGTPASGSEAVYMTARATSGFTVNVRTAPGVGNTVRVHWMLIR
jgi:hypothetical protein